MHAMANTGDGSLFSDDWAGKEELKLLEAIDEFGYGNWYSGRQALTHPVALV